MSKLYNEDGSINIKKLLEQIIKSKYEDENFKINIDDNAIDFMSTILNEYRKTIVELSESDSLYDLVQSYKTVTPKGLEKYITNNYKKLLEKHTDKSKSSIFLKLITTYLGIKILQCVIKCAQKHGLNELTGTCFIYSFINNEDLKDLTNRTGILLANKLEDVRVKNRAELVNKLKDQYNGIEKFPDSYLVYLSSPSEIPDYTEYITHYIKYYYITKNTSDYTLETMTRLYDFLFPSKISEDDLNIFKKDKNVRGYIYEIVVRILSFYGFELDKKEIVVNKKELNRTEKGLTVGLYSSNNYERITKIMTFLITIDMEYLASILLLTLCKAMRMDKKLYSKIKNSDALKSWISLYPYIKINSFLEESKQKKKSSVKESSVSDSFTEEPHPKKKHICKVLGLNYNGNSCYMDSALICIFGVPNKVITDGILTKDLDTLKDGRKLWSQCSKDINKDIGARKNIQKALVDISDSMRGSGKVKYCSNLRSMLKYCSVSQKFHETGTQDSGEFLTYLFNMFQVDVARTLRMTYGGNNLDNMEDMKAVTAVTDNNSSPIIDIEATRLVEAEKYTDITSFIEKSDLSVLDEENIWVPDSSNPDIFYIIKRETYAMISSPYIVFNLTRKYGEPVYKKGKFSGMKTTNIWKKVSAPEKFVLGDNELNLTGIVVHTGGAHYVANFKCEGEWYWYDDSPGKSSHTIKHVGSYEQMLKTSPNPLSHGTLFFYT